jgi:very-short-patch-repair endonuclease
VRSGQGGLRDRQRMEVPDWLDELAPLFDPTAPPRVVTLAEAAVLGFPFHVVRRRVHRGRWIRLAPGVYCTDPPAGRADHLRAATKHGGPGAVVSGAAALAEFGFRTAPQPARELVLVPAAAGARSCGRIVVRRTARLPGAAARPGPAVAPAARAVVDHARTLPNLDDVRAVVAEAVQREFCNVDELWEEVAAGARNGRALVRQAVHEVTAGARSAPEARAARLVKSAGLGPFRQNAPIRVRGRRYVADFLWPDLAAILEIDSVEHHFQRLDWQRTLARHFELEAGGYSVTHLPPSALRDGAAFIRLVQDWLKARRASLGL